MKRKLVVILFLVLTLFLLINVVGRVTRQKVAKENDVKTADPVRLVGVIRTTGLRPEEKAGVGISNDQQGNYQLITPDQHYYLMTQDSFADSLIGKCVLLDVYKSQITYYANTQLDKRQAFMYPQVFIEGVQNLQLQDFSGCNPYGDSTGPAVKQNPRSFTGILMREVRPAPDIGYDYVVKVQEGFKDPSGSSGIPGLLLYNAVVWPTNNTIWKDMELNIGKKITVEGSYDWGYAESMYLLTTKIISVM